MVGPGGRAKTAQPCATTRGLFLTGANLTVADPED